MQIYALNEKAEKVLATQASRFKDYWCAECHQSLRVRGGTLRRLHFYHQGESRCRQQGKSLEHLNIQYTLKKKLSGSNIFLEHAFPEINRIADVYWPEKKLIFEVQCSKISPDEIKNASLITQSWDIR